MRPRTLFFLGLAALLAVYAWYGANRFALGVDFTDEGAYLAWPLRRYFGEPAFSSETMTLVRPLAVFFTLPYDLHPGITLYEFRLLGWSVHLAAFAVFAWYLFSRSGRPGLSLLAASVPFFACHLFGLATPSYNGLSSDFFLITLCLLGAAGRAGLAPRRQFLFHLCAGLTLWITTLAHPAFGVVAAVLLGREVWSRGLLRNLARGQPTPSNAGLLLFVAGWIGFAVYLAVTGALAVWWQRIALTRSFAGKALQSQPLRFAWELATSPFTHSAIGVGVAVVALAALLATRFSARARPVLGLVLLAGIIVTFSHEPDRLPLALAAGCLVIWAASWVRPREAGAAAELDERFLLTLAVLGAVLCATSTYYFSPLRSWTSGLLALPFVFGAGLLPLFADAQPGGERAATVPRLLVTLILGLAVVCVARDHYGYIHRDAPPALLTADFRTPKLRHIRSTPERAAAVDALYDYLHPRLSRGEAFLAFDDAPFLYYLFDTRPVYGLTWAVRYTQSPAALSQLNRELLAGALPRYAVRTLVDLSNPRWAPARRTAYDDYPLNETVVSRYELDCTLFPFEVWRLKSAIPGTDGPDRKKASP